MFGAVHTIHGACAATRDSANVFSKKVYNHSCAVALLLFHYNYARVNMTA